MAIGPCGDSLHLLGTSLALAMGSPKEEKPESSAEELYNAGVDLLKSGDYADAAANVLTNPALDPEAKIPEYKVCAAKVKRVGKN